MRKLLIATRNKGKFLEIKKALKGRPFELLGLDAVKKIPKNFKVKETGKNFRENAILKAKIFAKKTGFLTLADDSGLEVDALAGRPGIYSSRYAEGTDKERCLKLLQEMKNIPDKKRASQFRCVIAIFDSRAKKLTTCEGICKGKITKKPKGDHGFGYDSIFYLPKLKKTMAQLRSFQKNAFSHRGKALRKAKNDLEKFLIA